MRKPHWIEWDCEICGRHVKKMRREVGIMHKRRFCSHECADKGNSGSGNHEWAGGYIAHNHPLWRKNRLLVLERDNYQCQNCNKSKDELGKSPDTHHIKKRDEFSSDEEFHSENNMVTLCHKCHMKAEYVIHKNKRASV